MFIQHQLLKAQEVLPLKTSAQPTQWAPWRKLVVLDRTNPNTPTLQPFEAINAFFFRKDWNGS